jgi:phage shock protein PspC (stress-responsive transcriptional regulator)
MEKRLCKSNRNKVLAGVCGGIAEYFNINPFIVRLIFIVSSGATGIVYLILAFFLPDDNDEYTF